MLSVFPPLHREVVEDQEERRQAGGVYDSDDVRKTLGKLLVVVKRY